MKALAKLQFIIGAKTAQLKNDLKKAEGFVGKFKAAMSSLGGVMAAAFAVAGISNFIKKSVEAADVQLKAEASLLVALKGREDVQARLLKQASERQKVTLYGDEETIRAQSMLAQMGLEERAITRLIPLIQDMATAKGMDLVQASDLVAKSVGSSTNALSRYGISIEGAVGSSERLNSAVTALTAKFAGQSEVAAKTGTGALTQLKNTFGDLQEEIGRRLIPVITTLAAWLNDNISRIVSSLAGKIGDFSITMAKHTMQWQKFGAVMKYVLSGGNATAWTIYQANIAAAQAQFDSFVKDVESKKGQISGGVLLGEMVAGAPSVTGKSSKKTTPTKPRDKGLVAYGRADEMQMQLQGIAHGYGLAAEAASEFSAVMTEMTHPISAVAGEVSELQVSLAGLAEYWKSTAGAADLAAGMFYELANAQEVTAESTAKAVYNAIRMELAAKLASSIGTVIEGTLKAASGLGPLAIPIAAAAGAGAGALFNKLVPKLATGGIIPPGFSNDTYPALLSSGETVIPKPKGLGSSGMNVNVSGVIFGDNILISNNRAQYRNNRVRGY